jgi:MFS family permease
MAENKQCADPYRTPESQEKAFNSWTNVVLAAVLMLATLPGRTQGLGLITEPLMKDLHIDRLAYADLNLWATLLGAFCCLPAGALIDRLGLRLISVALLVPLGITVWAMSHIGGGLISLFVLVLLTRGLGQSALSVVSITCVGKTFRSRVGLAMGVYSVLLSILFAAAFGVVGHVVSTGGWRSAWSGVALALIVVITPLVVIFLREQPDSRRTAERRFSSTDSALSDHGIGETPGASAHPGLMPITTTPTSSSADFTLPQALRTCAFWIFGGATALFGLVSSGLGLFNEAVLAERGFGQDVYHLFLVVTTLISLVGQFFCGWLALRWPLQRLLGVAMILYAVALAMLPWAKSYAALWVFASLVGWAGGMIIVCFFAVWSLAFGRTHLGRIQGGAQILSVIASAAGPLLLTKCALLTGSYTISLLIVAPAVFLLGIAAWRVAMPRAKEDFETSWVADPAAG